MDRHDYENYTSQTESFISPITYQGMIRAVDAKGGVWLYAKIPNGKSLNTTATNSDRVNAHNALLSFFNALGDMVDEGALKYRNLLSSYFREFHIIASAMPSIYVPPVTLRGSTLYDYLAEKITPLATTRRKNVYIGVRLLPTGRAVNPLKKPNMLERMLNYADDIAFSIRTGMESYERYTADRDAIAMLMRNCGLIPFTDLTDNEMSEQIHNMKTWWIPRSNTESLPVLVENDHLHVFPDIDTAVTAKRLYDNATVCTNWDIPTQYPATLFYARSTDFSENAVTDPSNLWVAKLLADSNSGGCDALGVSIRGKVEPSPITRSEISRNKASVEKIMEQRAKHDRHATQDQEELLAELNYKKAIYNQKNMPATLIELTCTVAVAGTPDEARLVLNRVQDIDFVNRNTGVEQVMAFQSMQPCSPIRVRPYELHWSSTVVSGAGLSAMSQGGDMDGALLGFTESDRQPVYLSPRMVSDEDSKPFLTVIGQTGSGKTMLLMNLAQQWARQVPVIFFDPKQGSDLSAGVQQVGGTTYSMDTDLGNGVFDPMSVMDNAETGVNMATNMLSNIFYSGTENHTMKEATIRTLMAYGARVGGKVSTGSAMQYAVNAFNNDDPNLKGLDATIVNETYRMLKAQVKNDPILPLICSFEEQPARLRNAEGLTYFRSGQLNLNPPSDGNSTVTGRIQQWLLRLAIFGMGQAVAGRYGMVILDEAWMALSKDKGTAEVVDEWGRLARSQRFTPVLGSQKAGEFVQAGLAGAISRVIILAMDNMSTAGGLSESQKALRLAGIADETGYLNRRLPQDSTIGDGAVSAPNWDSMRSLFKKNRDGSRRNVRGSVGVFVDRGRSPILVENVIPPSVLRAISTTARDVEERERAQQHE